MTVSFPRRRAIQQQGCCLCEDKRKRLPRFFRETTKNPGLEDNKHALVQTTYTMVGRLYVDLTICWELLSGLYYQEFEAMLDASDVAIHRPSRVNEGTDWAYTKDGADSASNANQLFNLNFGKMASARCRTASTPSMRPRERLRAS